MIYRILCKLRWLWRRLWTISLQWNALKNKNNSHFVIATCCLPTVLSPPHFQPSCQTFTLIEIPRWADRRVEVNVTQFGAAFHPPGLSWAMDAQVCSLLHTLTYWIPSTPPPEGYHLYFYFTICSRKLRFGSFNLHKIMYLVSGRAKFLNQFNPCF